MKKIVASALVVGLIGSFLTVGALAAEQGARPAAGELPAAAQEFAQGQRFGGGMAAGGQQTALQSAESAAEIVYGTAENSAAALEADMANATYLTVSESSGEVKISEAGTYVISGKCADGGITVKKGVTGVVLVLQDLDLASSSGAALSVNKEAEAKIIISGSVTLTDNEDPADETSEDSAVADAYDGAALKVKAGSSVYLTGDGTLTVIGNAKNGIKAGDDASVILDGAAVSITAANDGINTNYDLTILSGSVTVTAGDDAIHSDRILTLGSADGSGPVVQVLQSAEGLEGTVVNLLGGDVTVNSSDDAVNAANADGAYESELTYSVNMTGGKLTIVSSGDGIDSNGNINLVGGSASVRSASMGGEAGIDYVGQLYLADSFQLSNASGVSGPDGMPGGRMGGMFGGQTGGMFGGQTGSAPDGEANGMPGGEMGGMPGGEMGGMPGGRMGGMFGGQTGSAPEGEANGMPGGEMSGMPGALPEGGFGQGFGRMGGAQRGGFGPMGGMNGALPQEGFAPMGCPGAENAV